MNTTIIRPYSHYVPSTTLVLAAIFSTLGLFFLDEGFFDFRWMMDGANWIAFTIYCLSLFLGQYTVNLVMGRLHFRLKSLAVIGLGLGLGLAFALLFIFSAS